MPMIDYITSMKDRGMMDTVTSIPPTELETLRAENDKLTERIATLNEIIKMKNQDVQNLEEYLKAAILSGKFDMSDAYEIAMMFDLSMTKTLEVEIVTRHRGTIQVPLDTDEFDLEDCIEADLRTTDPIMLSDLWQDEVEINVEGEY